MNDNDPMHKIAAWDWIAVIVMVAAAVGLLISGCDMPNW